MTFRDDHDAALARADALEDEVERTKRERDALAAKVKELEEAKTVAEKSSRAKPKPEKVKPGKRAPSESSRSPSDDTKNEKRAVYIGVGATVILFGFMMLFGISRSCSHTRAVDEWKAKSDARNYHRSRWAAVVSIEPCVRRVAYDSTSARRHTPDKADPRKAFIWPFTDGIVGNCLGGAHALLKDQKTSPAIRTALGRWLDVQRDLEAPTKALAAYYGNSDWKEDNFEGAPALWKPVLGLLARQVATIEVVRRDVLPALRAEIRDHLATHEKSAGRDEIYWKGALAMALWEINDRSYEAAGIYAGREPDDAAAAAAIRPQMVKFLELTKSAPIEVRREIRKLDWITTQVVAGGPLRGETPLWHLAYADHQIIGTGHENIPALPPDPGERPVDPD